MFKLDGYQAFGTNSCKFYRCSKQVKKAQGCDATMLPGKVKAGSKKNKCLTETKNKIEKVKRCKITMPPEIQGHCKNL